MREMIDGQVTARKMEDNEAPAMMPRKQKGAKGFWATFMQENVLTLKPGERVEIAQRLPRRWTGPQFLQNIQSHISDHVRPFSPWNYSAALTARMTVVVSVLP